jgi:simple sugar transport system ATP-binding protein
VSFTLDRGMVVGLLGDNGAGKSTLVKCLSGRIRPSGGQILIDGRPTAITGPEHARELGIETVHQDLALLESLDVVANLFMNRELVRSHWPARRLGWLDRKAMERQARAMLDQLEIRVPSLRQPVASLSGGQRQAIAVGRAVGWGQHIVLLDEPAAALGVEQSAHVLELCERLAARGVAVLLVSHNMQHVLDVCQRAVVLRHGAKVADRAIDGLTGQDLVALITGAERELRGVG